MVIEAMLNIFQRLVDSGRWAVEQVPEPYRSEIKC